MNKLIFNETSFDVAENGISASTDTLVATLVTDDFDKVEDTVASVEDIVQTLEDGTKVASYKGYTKLTSLEKKFNQIIYYEEVSHEEEVPVIDPETGEPTGETKTVTVTEQVPVYGDVIVVTLFQPTLEDTVADQGEQITEIQEALVEIIG